MEKKRICASDEECENFFWNVEGYGVFFEVEALVEKDVYDDPCLVMEEYYIVVYRHSATCRKHFRPRARVLVLNRRHVPVRDDQRVPGPMLSAIAYGAT